MNHYGLRWAIALCLTMTIRAGILVGPVHNQATGHDYYLIDSTSWLGAEVEAQRMEGHLAVIETEAENQWIANTFRPFAGSFWIGYTDTLIEGEFRTVDGQKTAYRNFAPNQPDNNGNEDYVEMLTGTPTQNNGVWNDRNELSVLPGLVEVGLPDVLAGPIRNQANGSTYYLLSDSSWRSAQAKARELGGNLVAVSSREENDWLMENFSTWDPARTGLVWIGFTDEAQEGTFRWISGESNRFQNWLPGEPNNVITGGIGENYAIIATGAGGWNDIQSTQFSGVGILRLGVVEIDRPVLEMRVSEVELRWNARFGKLYQLQQRPDLAGSDWIDSGQPFLGKDGFLNIKVPVPTDATGRLFRVVEQP